MYISCDSDLHYINDHMLGLPIYNTTITPICRFYIMSCCAAFYTSYICIYIYIYIYIYICIRHMPICTDKSDNDYIYSVLGDSSIAYK